MKTFEIWNFFKLGVSMLFGFALVFLAIYQQNYIFGMFGVFSAWQGGWGVKLVQEKQRLDNE